MEISSQGDGATVGIQEASTEEGYVKATLSITVDQYPAGTEVQVKALDFTSQSDEKQVKVLLPNKKMASVKKSDVKLFEAGVYNSETDIKSNPKTGENKPDEMTGRMEAAIDGLENSIVELQDLKKMIDEETSLSSETIETCIAELTNYRKSLMKEREQSSSTTVAN